MYYQLCRDAKNLFQSWIFKTYRRAKLQSWIKIKLMDGRSWKGINKKYNFKSHQVERVRREKKQGNNTTLSRKRKKLYKSLTHENNMGILCLKRQFFGT